MEEKNLELWDQVCTTDPSMAKSFDNGTFSGTTIDPQYQFREATKVLGPFGQGWWVENERYQIVDANENAKVMFFYGVLSYMWEGKSGSVVITSGVKFAYKAKSGREIVDVEASKKVLTNAIGKGLSRLGFNADIYLGKFDDSAYVEAASLMDHVNGGKTINEIDAKIVRDLVEQTDSDLEKMLVHVGAESVEKMTQPQFSKFVTAMKGKLKR